MEEIEESIVNELMYFGANVVKVTCKECRMEF
jgi:uncharacterized Zn finger protein (UPF0148 family)